MVNVDGNKVVFQFYRPQAQSVHVVGDFNGWRDNELCMTPGLNGYWTAVLYLPQGDYKFRYRCDGQWFTDYAAFGIEYGPLGADSVIRVHESTRVRMPIARLVARPKQGWTKSLQSARIRRKNSKVA
jgi:1,4-alpha-glucan branching enzyme